MRDNNKDSLLNGTGYPIHKSVIKRLSRERSVELYEKLIRKKSEVQNRPYLSKLALSSLGSEKGGDQADQVNRLQAETQYTGQIQRGQLFDRSNYKSLGKNAVRGVWSLRADR